MRTEMKMSKAKLRRFRAVVARVDEIIDVAWLRDILGPEYDEKSPGIRYPARHWCTWCDWPIFSVGGIADAYGECFDFLYIDWCEEPALDLMMDKVGARLSELARRGDLVALDDTHEEFCFPEDEREARVESVRRAARVAALEREVAAEERERVAGLALLS